MSHITKLLRSQDELYHRATRAMVGEQYQSYWGHHMGVKLQLVRQSCEGYITEPHGAMAVTPQHQCAHLLRRNTSRTGPSYRLFSVLHLAKRDMTQRMVLSADF